MAIVDFLTGLDRLWVIWILLSTLIVVAISYLAVALHHLNLKLDKAVSDISSINEITLPAELKKVSEQINGRIDQAQSIQQGRMNLVEEEATKNLKTNSQALGQRLSKHGKAIATSERKRKELEKNIEYLTKGLADLSNVVTNTTSGQTKTNKSHRNAHSELVNRVADLETLIPAEEAIIELLNRRSATPTQISEGVKINLAGIKLATAIHSLLTRKYIQSPNGVTFSISDKGQQYLKNGNEAPKLE